MQIPESFTFYTLNIWPFSINFFVINVLISTNFYIVFFSFFQVFCCVSCDASAFNLYFFRDFVEFFVFGIVYLIPVCIFAFFPSRFYCVIFLFWCYFFNDVFPGLFITSFSSSTENIYSQPIVSLVYIFR